MQKDDLVYIGHMLDTARSIAEKIDSAGRPSYDADENLRLALAHLLQVIGEAASRVSRETRDAHSNVEWVAIIGMRQKIVHDYMNVDDDIVWETANRDIPPLIEQLAAIVDS